MNELIKSIAPDNLSAPPTNEGTLGPFYIGIPGGIFGLNITIKYKFIGDYFEIQYIAELMLLKKTIYTFNLPVNSDGLTITYGIDLKVVNPSITVTAVVSEDKICLNASVHIIYDIPLVGSGDNTYALEPICIPRPL